MKNKLILLLVFVAIVLAIAFRLSSNKKKLDENKSKKVDTNISIPVLVDSVQLENFDLELTKMGVVAPYKEVKVLALNKSGLLTHLYVKLGDHVHAGQIIAKIESQNQELDLQKASLHVQKLKNDLHTYTELLEGNAATQEKVNSIRQDYEDAVNQLNQAKRNITDATIKAPSDGIISNKAVEEGMFVNTGAEIATIIDLVRTKAQIRLTETEVYQIQKGNKVSLTADVYPNKIFSGKVDFISPQADETHNYMVEILVDPHDASILRSGTFVYAKFAGKKMDNVLTIPRESLIESVQNPYVYMIVDGIAHLKKIETNGEINGKMILKNGLDKGQIIVTSGQINLKEGAKVNISK